MSLMHSSRSLCKLHNMPHTFTSITNVEYSIINPLTHNKSRAFACALLFAQEYGILAASAQNRPFVPFGTVILEGVPKDMKAVFRGWDDGEVNTNNLMVGRPKGALGRTLRVVPLSAAIAAVRGG